MIQELLYILVILLKKKKMLLEILQIIIKKCKLKNLKNGLLKL